MKEEIEKVMINYVKNHAPVLYILVNDQKKIIEINDYALQLLGSDKIGENLIEIFIDFDGSLDIDELIMKSAKNHRLNLDTSEDLPDTLHFSFFDLGEKAIVFGKPDIDELKNLRKKMVSLNNEFANLSRKLQKRNAELNRVEKALDSSLNGVVITNVEGIITYVNSALLDVWEFDRREIIGEDISKLFKEPERYEEIIELLEDQSGWIGEFKAKRADGTDFHVQGSAAVIKRVGNESGEMVFNLMDITEKKETEERRDLLHSLLRHDVKNKAQIVQGYLQLLEDFDLPGEAEDFVEKAMKGNRESVNLIEKVRLLLGAEEEESKPVNILSTIKEAVDMNESLAEDKKIEINIKCPSMECEVQGGPLLKEVFSNIIENSIYHSEGNRIQISGEINGEEAKCSIEDDGKGIPDDKKEVIFEKGYTTDTQRGTGLGMFLVKMLLEIYGGDIGVKDSELGGARFDVRLKKI